MKFVEDRPERLFRDWKLVWLFVPRSGFTHRNGPLHGDMLYRTSVATAAPVANHRSMQPPFPRR
jgi:hypothetical protein